MHAYFSHSYRDVSINGHFIERFVREDLALRADQKTDVWCVAKLERYLQEASGFVSVITKRVTDTELAGYSPYIGRELHLARRARVPRLLFVDEKVLQRHLIEFPEDAVGFDPDTLTQAASSHDAAIRRFRLLIESSNRARRTGKQDEAIVVASNERIIRDSAVDAAEILRRHGFHATIISRRFDDQGLDDIRLLEAIWRAELGVFIMTDKLSETYLALAIARAHCIPSIRLTYHKQPIECSVAISGAIAWHEPADMLSELDRQVTGYREGLVRPVEIAEEATPSEAARKIGSMRWRPRDDNLWKFDDKSDIANHVRPEQSFVQDEVNRIRRAYGSPLGTARSRESSLQLCRLAYDSIRRYHFGFEVEPFDLGKDVQVIRTPSQIETHRTANCLDLACLFAAVLEAAQQAPIIVIVDRPTYSHALVGVRSPSEPVWVNPGRGDLVRAMTLGDVLFFDPTGAVEAEEPVAAETKEERQDKLLDFTVARLAAERLLVNPDSNVRHIIDIEGERGIIGTKGE
jgi:hypothetical protein